MVLPPAGTTATATSNNTNSSQQRREQQQHQQLTTISCCVCCCGCGCCCCCCFCCCYHLLLAPTTAGIKFGVRCQQLPPLMLRCLMWPPAGATAAAAAAAKVTAANSCPHLCASTLPTAHSHQLLRVLLRLELLLLLLLLLLLMLPVLLLATHRWDKRSPSMQPQARAQGASVCSAAIGAVTCEFHAIYVWCKNFVLPPLVRKHK